MKARGVILSICAMMVFFASYACANEPEPIQPSTAKPVMVPYLNKSISEVKSEYGSEHDIGTDSFAEHGADAGDNENSGGAGEDCDSVDYGTGAVLTNAGRMEAKEDADGCADNPVLTYLGDWTVTAYCPCAECCGIWATGCTASGVLATPEHTAACGILPFGTKIMIDGIIYTVEDTGVDGEWVDIFFSTHEEALAYGMQTKAVYLVEG